MSIDYVKARGFNSVRKIKKVYGYRYLPFAPFIVACRLLDWRHTEILDFLYSEVEDFKSIELKDRIDNNHLSKMVSYWKSKNLIDFNQVGKEKQLILGSGENQKETAIKTDVNIFNTYFSVIDFLKSLNTKIAVTDDIKESAKVFFDSFKSSMNLETMTNEFILHIDNQASQ